MVFFSLYVRKYTVTYVKHLIQKGIFQQVTEVFVKLAAEVNILKAVQWNLVWHIKENWQTESRQITKRK